MADSESKASEQRENLIFASLTYIITIVVFFPIIHWVFQQTKASEQLLHAFIILGFSGVFLAYENQEKLTLKLKHDRLSTLLLIGAFIIVALKTFFNWPLLILVSFCMVIASIIRFTFGGPASRIASAMIVAFFIFLVLIITMPRVDWPLRHIAGSWSAWFLEMMGQGTQLLLVQQQERIELVLTVNERPFIVAPECNGFGVISASILLTLLLTIYRKVSLLDKGLLLVGAVLLAFVSNIIRILIIVNLAPIVENYMLMHEIVGTAVFYGSLALLWWFIIGFGKNNTTAAPVAAN